MPSCIPSFQVLRGSLVLTGALLLTPWANSQCIETEVDELMASNGQVNGAFGTAVDFDGSWIAVGALGRNAYDGAVYLYSRGPVVQEIQLDPQLGTGGQFGEALDLDGNTLVIGEPNYNTDEGRVHVYEFDGAVWSFLQTIDGSGAGGERYGSSVSVDEAAGRMVIGAPAPAGIGSFEIFEYSGGAWVKQRRITPVGQVNEQLGFSVSVCGNSIAVGAPYRNSSQGRVLVFEGAGLAWGQAANLAPVTGSEFGNDVLLKGTDLFIGSPSYSETAADAGAVFHYQRDVTGWNEIGVIEHSLAAIDQDFGYCLDVHEDVMVVGSPRYLAGGQVVGAAVQYRNQGGTWVEQQTLVQDAPKLADDFALRVAVHEDDVLAGARYHDGVSAASGTVFVYDVPGLSLSVNPELPVLGDILSVQTCGGGPGQLVGLFVTAVDDVPLFQSLVLGAFTVQGDFKIVAPFNDPTLVGLKVDLMALGLNAGGKAAASPVKTFQF